MRGILAMNNGGLSNPSTAWVCNMVLYATRTNDIMATLLLPLTAMAAIAVDCGLEACAHVATQTLNANIMISRAIGLWTKT